jgi:hypothetical protein
MRKTRPLANLMIVCWWTLWCTNATAGPYADDMAKCLVKETAAADRTALLNWIFSAMALHPDVEAMASIGAELRAEINKSAGALFQRLLVDSCREETRLAIRYEGQPAIQSAFGLLGQIAMQELFANPKVAAGLGELEKNVDRDKIAELSAPEPAPEG